MDLFKIKINQLFLLIILSTPVGVFLYLQNSNIISIEYNFPRGYGYVHNLCNNIPVSYRADILSEDEIKTLINSYSSNTLRVTIEMPTTNSLYQITLKGTNDQLGTMHQKIAGIKSELNKLESNRFKDLLGDISLHCGGASYRLYKYIPLNSENSQEIIKNRYKIGYLLFLVICPIIILYLIFIGYRYLNFIGKKDK